MTIRAQGTSGVAIDAQEINLKAGKSQTAELSFSETDIERMADGDSTAIGVPDAISFRDFKNKSIITQNTFFGNIGYDGSLPTGSITDSVLAASTDGGYTWHGVSSYNEARWLSLYQSWQNQLRFKPSIGTGTSPIISSAGANFEKITIRKYDSGTYSSSEFRRTYGAFSSSGRYWYWNSVTILGSTAGLKRYVSI